MPIDTTINPGDIITSDLMLSIINTLNRLEEEINELGGLSRVQIRAIQAGGRVGAVIRLTGVNFLSPPADNIITVAGERVSEFFPPGTSTELTFLLPESIVIDDPLGDVVNVLIDAGEFGRASASYLLLPASTEPGVDISAVTDPSSGEITLSTERDAVITGSNLGTDASDITIVFEHGGVNHPVTNISSAAADGAQVVFTVPLIDTIDPPNPIPNTGITTLVFTRGSTTARPRSTNVVRLA